MLGLVVSPNLVRDDNLVLIAIFVDKDRPLYFVRNVAHCLQSRMSKEERKILEKMVRHKGLEYGDWIEFSEANVENRIINEYAKVRSAMECRPYENCMQFQTECVFSPDADGRKSLCYSSFFGYVDVDQDIAKRFVPDVAYSCWVSTQLVRETQKLRVIFGEFADLADNQELARLAPWNINDPRFVLDCASLGEGDDAYDDLPDDEIVDGKGVLSGIRNIFSKKYFEYPIVIAYSDPEKSFAPGSYLHFDAVYNAYLKAYIVRYYRMAARAECIPTILVDFGETVLLKVEVAHQPDQLLFGYVRETKYDLGVICDSDSVLAPIFLNQSVPKPLEVCVEDLGFGRFCRFAIRTLSKPTTSAVEAAVKKGMDPISMKGFYVGGGHVFIPQRSTFEVKFSEPDRRKEDFRQIEIGKWLSLTAQGTYIGDRTVFVITQWQRVAKAGALPVLEGRLTDTGYVFKAKCHYDKDLAAFRSEEFGYLDDPDRKANVKLKKDRTVRTFWVKYNLPGSRTPFGIFSVQAPKEVKREVAEHVNEATVISDGGEPEKAAEESNDFVIVDSSSAVISGFTEDECKPVTQSGDSGLGRSAKTKKSRSERRPKLVFNSECSSADCAGRALLKRVLNDRNVLRLMRANGMQELVVRMVTSISGSH